MAPSRMPSRVEPMLASLVAAPFHRDGWVFEEKYDGVRLVAFKNGARVRLVTRNQIDRAADFPTIASAIAALDAPTLILDGEVVTFDADGVSRFQLLQRRALGESTQPPTFVVFDVLFARSRDLRAEPLAARRAVLEREVPEAPPLQRSRRVAENGLVAFREAARRGMEGVIAKDARAPYREGARSDRWLKVKVRHEDEFVIGGFTAPGGSRAHFGAVLVGAFERGKLQYAGKVGTGFDARTLRGLHARMQPLVRATSPFSQRVREPRVTWVEPCLVGQFAYAEITRDRCLRQPVFLGLRDDKPAAGVRWPTPSRTRSKR